MQGYAKAAFARLYDSLAGLFRIIPALEAVLEIRPLVAAQDAPADERSRASTTLTDQ